MRKKDMMILSLKNVLNNKVRTIFTVIGISIAYSAILMLISLGLGFQKMITDQFSSQGSLKTIWVSLSESGIKAIDKEIIKNIESINGVKDVTPYVLIPGSAEYGKLSEPITLQGVSQDYFRNNPKLITYGSIAELDGIDKAIVSLGALDNIGIDKKDAIGRVINIKIKPDKNLLSANGEDPSDNLNSVRINALYEDTAPVIYMDLASLEGVTGVDKYNSLTVKVNEEKDIESVKREIEDLDLSVLYEGDNIKKMESIFFVISITLGSFGLIALIVAIIGTVNTLSVSLIERTQEIGVLKSFGMKKRNIVTLFLSESIIITLLGTAGGILLAMLLELLVTKIFNDYAFANGGSYMRIFHTPISLVAAAIIFSIFIGLISGIAPALRAANINILDAYKYE